MNSKINFLYYYKAIVTEVYDGDTCTVDIDLGLNIWLRKTKIRLLGIDAPELKTEVGGVEARDNLKNLILNKQVIINTTSDKKDKYGRYLANIYLETKEELVNILDTLKFIKTT